MRKSYLAIVAASVCLLALPSCTQFQAAASFIEQSAAKIGNATVSPKIALVGSEAFDGLQDIATIYVALPRCVGSPGPKCSYYPAVVEIRKALKEGRKNRDALVRFSRTHPGQLGPQGTLDALSAAAASLESIFYRYNVRGAV